MLPNQVRIKPRVTYEIVYQDVIKNDPNCLGLCDPNTRHIYIKTNQSKQNIIKCFIHEWLHSAEAEFDIKIPHESIYKLEDAIYRFLTLNKFI
jgi:hypothetical protein